MLIIFFLSLMSCAFTSRLPSFVALLVEDRFAQLFLKPVEINLNGQNRCDLEPIAFLLPYTPTGPAYVSCNGRDLPLPPSSPDLVLTVTPQGVPVAIEPSGCVPPLQNITRPNGSILIYFRYNSIRLVNHYQGKSFSNSFGTHPSIFPVIQFQMISVNVTRMMVIQPQQLPQTFTLPSAYSSSPLYSLFSHIVCDSLTEIYYAVQVLGKKIDLTNALRHNYGSGTCLLLTMDVVQVNDNYTFDDRTGKIGVYVIDKQDALPLKNPLKVHINILYKFNVVNGN